MPRLVGFATRNPVTHRIETADLYGLARRVDNTALTKIRLLVNPTNRSELALVITSMDAIGNPDAVTITDRLDLSGARSLRDYLIEFCDALAENGAK